MQTRRLGTSGLKVSAVGLGGNAFGSTVDGDEAVDLIRCALDLGVTFLDTADVYSAGRSEELIGQAVKGRREQVVIATKARHELKGQPGSGGLSRHWLVRAVEGSLRRLATDYVDLLQAHAPDDETPLEETLSAMDDLVRQGKVRYVGCSNYQAWQLAQALGISARRGLEPWVSVQPRWNLLEGLDDPSLLPACRALGVGIIPYRPLASGILTGKYRRGEEPPPGTRAATQGGVRRRLTDENIAIVERLHPWASARGHSTGQLGIAWLLAHPEVSTVIAGARSAKQVQHNVAAAEWLLTPDERDDVARIVDG